MSMYRPAGAFTDGPPEMDDVQTTSLLGTCRKMCMHHAHDGESARCKRQSANSRTADHDGFLP
eukprot:5937423-Pleurochrysis_carterae.AAC.1